MTPPPETSPWLANLVDVAVILMLVIGIGQFRTPRRAKVGNWIAAAALGVAIFLVLSRHGIDNPLIVVGASVAGALIGVIIAFRIDMTGIPSMVALQHGMGGVAAFMVSIVEMVRDAATLGPVAKVSGFLGLIVGAATFSGSMLAALKLANKVKQAPTRLPGHNAVLLGLIAVIVALSALMWDLTTPWTIAGLIAIIALSMVLGHVFAMRIGGADMPVLISFLNATAGVAAAFCGVIIGNRLLIAAGATVASSGSILTHVMCKAMNRGLGGVFLGSRKTRGMARAKAPAAATPIGTPAGGPVSEAGSPEPADTGATGPATSSPTDATPLSQALSRLGDAKRVIVVPGYGMALAKAQFDVVRLANFLERQGKDVRFAIHPVAGRMPGHMNVLLAEADVDYEKLVEMDDVNRDFPDTDVVLVVGACDVVNPAANDPDRETPLSGMPILEAHRARCVVVCNLDERPGYSGVENPLYRDARTLMLPGDALATLRDLRRALGDTEGLEPVAAPTPQAAAPGPASTTGAVPGTPAPTDATPLSQALSRLGDAKRVIVVPGYGMALAKAQFDVVRLANFLERQGKDVRFAIHPVAGRMPGHMNVLLAEAERSSGPGTGTPCPWPGDTASPRVA